MQTRKIPLSQLSPYDEDAWRDLAARSAEPNPFFEVDFLVPAARYLSGGTAVVLLAAEDDGRFHACLPVRSGRLPAALSPVISSWRHHYGFLGTPLVAPELGVEAVASLLTTLRTVTPWPRVLVLELMGEDGPVASYLRLAAEQLGLMVGVEESCERGVTRVQDLEPGRLPPAFKKERRAKARQWRRLSEEVGNPVVVDQSSDPAGSADFLAMEAAGWKGKAGTALANRPEDAAFYREVTARFASSGRLWLHSLETARYRLAMQTSFFAGGALFDWKIAYDERFARYGPGAQLQLQVMDLARADGLCLIDSCADPEAINQLRLCPDRRRIVTFAIGARRLGGGSGLTLAVLLVRLRRRLRQLIHGPPSGRSRRRQRQQHLESRSA